MFYQGNSTKSLKERGNIDSGDFNGSWKIVNFSEKASVHQVKYKNHFEYGNWYTRLAFLHYIALRVSMTATRGIQVSQCDTTLRSGIAALLKRAWKTAIKEKKGKSVCVRKKTTRTLKSLAPFFFLIPFAPSCKPNQRKADSRTIKN